jgi:acetyltransferase-like isoleucine patch superfamily enzyme
MGRFGRLTRMALLFALPTKVARPLVNRMGYAIDKRARIGFSLVDVDRLEMAPEARIGHFNVVRGGYSLRMAEHAAIGHLNLVSRSFVEGTGGEVELRLGVWAKITGLHKVDLSTSIRIGDYSTVAGHFSQLWTHGYVHDMDGLGRYRVDGTIEIEDNVYVGSGSIISAGVRLGKGVIVGAGTTVAKSLLEPGLYVSSPLRVLPRPADPETRADLERVASSSGDIVYRKKAD